MPNQTKKKETLYDALVRKLYPGRFSGMSQRMAALLGFVLSQPDWDQTEHPIAWLSATSDGYLVSDAVLVGSVSDWVRNTQELFQVAELTPEEIAEFVRLEHKIDNWSQELAAARGRQGRPRYTFTEVTA